MIQTFLRRARAAALTLLLIALLIPQTSLAAGASLTGSSSVQAGNTVSLTLSVPSSVYGLTADLSYGDNLTFTNYNCSVSGWSILVNNNKFSAYGTSSTSGSVIVIKLKVSSSAKAGDVLSASFSNIVVSDGNSDTDLGSASWSGKVGAAPSSDCSLSSLSCSNATLSPTFASKTTYYTCTVPYAVEKLSLDWKKSDSSASVSVSGNENLVVGVNTVTVTVTAADGSTRTYTIEVTREQDPNYKPSTNANLSSLTIEGATLSPKFSPTVTDYIAYVPYETSSVTLSGEMADEKAKGVSGIGAVKLSATESETAITVTGTAEDGKSTQTYTIHVLRMPAYTGIIPTVEVIDPATIPVVPPLEIPGTLTLPLIGEVETQYVAIGAAVLLVIVLFLLGFLIGRGSGHGRDDGDDDADDTTPPTDTPPVLPYATGSVPRFIPREAAPQEKASDTQPLPTAAPVSPSATDDTQADTPSTEHPADEPTEANENEVRTMSLDDLLDDIHRM